MLSSEYYYKDTTQGEDNEHNRSSQTKRKTKPFRAFLPSDHKQDRSYPLPLGPVCHLRGAKHADGTFG